LTDAGTIDTPADADKAAPISLTTPPWPTSSPSLASAATIWTHHINFYGTYSFDLESEVREGHRPLRSPAA